MCFVKIPGLEKARLYMESVTYFMRHGGAIEVCIMYDVSHFLIHCHH